MTRALLLVRSTGVVYQCWMEALPKGADVSRAQLTPVSGDCLDDWLALGWKFASFTYPTMSNDTTVVIIEREIK